MNDKEIKEVEKLLKLIDNTRQAYTLSFEYLLKLCEQIENLGKLNPEKKEIIDEILNKIDELFEILKANRLNLT